MTRITGFETVLATFAALLLAAGMLWASTPAQAGFSCSQFGNQTVCTDDQGNTVNCSRFGNQTVCD